MWELALQVGRQSLEALLDGAKGDSDAEPKPRKPAAKRAKKSDAA